MPTGRAKRLFKLRDIAQYPSQDGCMSKINSALSHHIAQVTIAYLVGDIPAHAEDDYCRIKVAALEQRWGARRAIIHSADYVLSLLDAPEPSDLLASIWAITGKLPAAAPSGGKSR